MCRKKDINADVVDYQLIQLITDGNNEALVTLINRHKDFLFNLSFRMFGNIEDAKDASQEIWIKVITKLSSFKNNSGFRTWLYRLAVNHILNFKKTKKEQALSSFEQHRALIENLKSEEPSAVYNVENALLEQETKVECMTGMLLCLNKEQRIVFILGSIFNFNSRLGAEFLNVSPENFRQQLSRARKQLRNYMNNECSLINPNGKCSCKLKTQSAINAGIVNPQNLQFSQKHLKKVQNIAEKNTENVVENILEIKCQEEFQKHPFLILENEVLESVVNYQWIFRSMLTL
jgi:RNA polymerase sigma factor (sigma-70 family)